MWTTAKSLLSSSTSTLLKSINKTDATQSPFRLFNLTTTISARYFSKYLSNAATKRLALTAKRAKKGFVKGKGAKLEGRVTSKGRFIRDPKKTMRLIVPDLEGFKLKPYIAASVSKIPPEARWEAGAPKS